MFTFLTFFLLILLLRSHLSLKPLATIIPKPFVRETVIKRAAVPSRQELQSLVQQSQEQAARTASKNFLAANAKAAVAGGPRIVTVDPALPAPKRADYGQVPEYLRDRKAIAEAQAEEAARKQKESEGCPVGHRLMPEAERLETLELLKTSIEETKDLLSKMKFTSDAPSTVKRRTELEAKMKKLEDGIIVFSRQKVFVKL